MQRDERLRLGRREKDLGAGEIADAGETTFEGDPTGEGCFKLGSNAIYTLPSRNRTNTRRTGECDFGWQMRELKEDFWPYSKLPEPHPEIEKGDLQAALCAFAAREMLDYRLFGRPHGDGWICGFGVVLWLMGDTDGDARTPFFVSRLAYASCRTVDTVWVLLCLMVFGCSSYHTRRSQVIWIFG